MKLLSIVIASYNRSSYLEQLLDQIFSYPQNDIEVLVGNNASTDHTHAMLQ